MYLRDLSKISINSLRTDLNQNLKLKPWHDLRNLCEGYMSAIKSTLDIHAPLKEKKLTKTSKYPWFDPDAHRIKHERRIVERHWIRTPKGSDRRHYSHVNTCYKRHIFKSKGKYIVEQINANATNSKNLFKTLNGLIKGRKENPLPVAGSHEELANKFAHFFTNKIDTIQAKFDSNGI